MRFGPVCAALLAAACSPTVGTACDDTLARTVVFDERGSPAYAGQSIFISSCAGGGWACHSSRALHRYSAPAGTDFDLMLADDVRFEGAAARLYGAQTNTHRLRDDLFSQVVSGQQPPGAIGDRVIARSPVYRSFADATDAIGAAVPSVRTGEGREILRNWLACGSPVVQATGVSAPVVCTVDSDCPLTRHCTTDSHQCLEVGSAVAPRVTAASAHWGSLYQTQLAHSCALVGCHDAEDAASSGGLDLSTAAIGYASLASRITPSDADGSRVVQVLTSASMPYHRIDATGLGLLRDWISAGAAND